MDLESLNMRDKRNRFQVNRVDSVTSGHHSSSPSSQNFSPTLVAYKESTDVIVSSSTSPTRQSLSAESHGGGGGHSNGQSSYDTKYGKSFRHFTREALPRLDNYRNMMSIQAAYRPTLEELHDMTLSQQKSPTGANDVGELSKEGTSEKFGWIKGVFVRCLLNIWGVMLFLRLSWVVGQAGIVEACVIICLAVAVTLFTAISMSAISTNGQIKGAEATLLILSTTVVTLITSLSLAAITTNGAVKGGGTYFMISRTLGPEIGAPIGAIFALANAIAVAMYTVGFAESMVDLLKNTFSTFVVEDKTNSIRIIGTIAIVFQTGVVVIGMSWEAKAQIGLLVILLAAMVDFVIGSIIGPIDREEISKGFIGYNGSLFTENLMSNYRFSEGKEQDFFSVFSIFFPAATGILAGANISGDLADPQYSIPKGTLLAILVTTLSYLAFAFIAGSTVLRDAPGPDFLNSSFIDWNYPIEGLKNICYSYLSPLSSNETLDQFSNLTTNGTMKNPCLKHGLLNDFQVMELVSAWGFLIYLGCFAATLSSALASFVSAPKVFQALCKDNLYPYIEFFGKGYGKNNEPVRGYILTFIIALAFILIAELNAIAPLISNFFLAAYALINFSTFHASLAKPVGWRPTFRFYNMWMSLIGALLCVGVMFLISWVTALLTAVVILFLCLLVIHRKPDVNWGSSTQAQTYKNALTSVQQLNFIDEHVKNYRPQILVLSGLPSARPLLVDFAYLITKNLSLLVCGQIVKSSLSNRLRMGLREKALRWFVVHKIKGFYCSVDEAEFEEGAKALLQATGVGKLKPNILLMGFKENWTSCQATELAQYFNVIHKAFDMNLSVTLLRVNGGLDLSKKISFGEELHLSPSTKDKQSGELSKSKSSSNISMQRNTSNQSFSQLSHDLSKYLSIGLRNLVNASSADLTSSKLNSSTTGNKADGIVPQNNSALNLMYKSLDGSEIPPSLLSSLSLFHKKHKGETIDVWWLYDDGGLTLLLPYIITTRSNWASSKLRVFALANKKDEFDVEQRSMAGLLSKFRIDYSDLKVIPDINKKAQDSTKEFFDSYISQFRTYEASLGTDSENCSISDGELLAMKDKTNRHMRLRELLLEHSKNSSLIVMTLPMPRKGVVSAPLYMAWLELLTKDMPPFLLVRGNQTSVLTFYS